MQQTVLEWEAVLTSASIDASSPGQGAPLWIRLMLLVYVGGGLFFGCRFLFSYVRMFHLMRKGVKRRMNGIWLILTPEPVVSFSWMHHIVISEKDWAESGEEILTHEMAHIQNRHTIDLLLAEACILLYWFNPATWLLKRELQHIHEYEADESVIRKGIDAKKYQLLLIKKAVGSQRFTSVANSFNHSSLKKRISMMLKKKSNPWARLKYLYVLPLAACAIAAFARPEISHELEKISSVKLSEIIPDIQIPPDTLRTEKPLAPINIEDRNEHVNVNVDVDVDTDVDTDVDVKVEIEDIKIDLATIQEEIKVEIEKAKLEIEKAVATSISAEEMAKIIEEAQKELEKAKPEIEKAKAEMEKAKPELEKAKAELEKAVKIDTFVINNDPLILVDGKEVTKEEMNRIDPLTIESVSVFKNVSAIEKYGEKGVKGVIEIKLKKISPIL
jgi:hypothetical protein